jgi:hypothetical protein
VFASSTDGAITSRTPAEPLQASRIETERKINKREWVKPTQRGTRKGAPAAYGLENSAAEQRRALACQPHARGRRRRRSKRSVSPRDCGDGRRLGHAPPNAQRDRSEEHDGLYCRVDLERFARC